MSKRANFSAPWDMKNIAAKLEGVGNTNIMLTERGVTFGYNTLVSDMRALPQMAEDRLSGGVRRHPFGAAARRSWRGQRWASDGSCRSLARAALSIGVAALFLETHQDPDNAPQRCALIWYTLKDMPALLKMLRAFDQLAKDNPFSS